MDLFFKTEGSNYKSFFRFLITSPGNCLWRWQWRAERKDALDWSMAAKWKLLIGLSSAKKALIWSISVQWMLLPLLSNECFRSVTYWPSWAWKPLVGHFLHHGCFLLAISFPSKAFYWPVLPVKRATDCSSLFNHYLMWPFLWQDSSGSAVLDIMQS